MRITLCFKALCLTGLIALAGCSSTVTEPEQYSGFLKDYSGLTESETHSGKTILRWIDPEYKSSNYDSLVFNPVTYYPEPKPTTELGEETLSTLLNYVNKQLKEAAAQRKPLVTTPGPHSLIFRGAITAVDSTSEGLQFYEVVPVALIVAGTQMATGHRTMNTHLYYEAELIDAATMKPVMRIVRKGQGEDLSNENTKFTIQTLKKVVDDLATDATLYDSNQKSSN